jgi:hypothetical protein
MFANLGQARDARGAVLQGGQARACSAMTEPYDAAATRASLTAAEVGREGREGREALPLAPACRSAST